MIMLWTDVLSCLQRGNSESQRLIKSVDDVQELGPIIAGFANHKGGIIILGMDVKNYHLLGTSLDSKTVADMVEAQCTPAVVLEMNSIRRGDRVILAIQVFESPKKPVYFNRQAYLISEFAPFLPELYVPAQPTVFHVLDNHSAPSQPSTPAEATEVSDAVVSGPAKWDRTPSPQMVQVPVQTNFRQRKGLEFLETHSFISNKSYRSMFDISHKTAHLELVDLVNKGFLTQQGNGRSTSYILKKTVEFAVA